MGKCGSHGAFYDVSPRDGCAAPMFACYTLTHYAGVVRRIIIEWKHSHSYGLDQRILQIWRRCVGGAFFALLKKVRENA